MLKQKTIAKEALFFGIGVHTGSRTELRFVPAEPNTGIRFVRVDLPGKPEIKADIRNVIGFVRGTTIGNSEVNVHTVEHVLAALSGFGITNLIVEINDKEPPVGDGSSLAYVDMIKRAGVVEQDDVVEVFAPSEVIHVRENDTILVILPYDGFKISYTVSFNHPNLKAQYLSLDINQQSFVDEIASARTFCFYREVEALMNQGLIKGGSLDNAVVIGDNAIFAKEELRYSNEFVRHKMLDLIGDTYLLGMPIRCHIVAIKSGHAANIKLTQQLLAEYQKTQSKCGLAS